MGKVEETRISEWLSSDYNARNRLNSSRKLQPTFSITALRKKIAYFSGLDQDSCPNNQFTIRLIPQTEQSIKITTHSKDGLKCCVNAANHKALAVIARPARRNK
jgi:hypothetical protein